MSIIIVEQSLLPVRRDKQIGSGVSIGGGGGSGTSGGGGSKWTTSEADIYRLSKVGVGIIPIAQSHIKGTLSTALTGTVAVTNSSANIVGTSTLFLTELIEGDSIKIVDEIFTVLTITSNTALTLDSAFVGATANGLTAYCDPNLLDIDNGVGVNKLRVNRSGYVLFTRKKIDFTATATPTISNYATLYASLFGQYPMVSLYYNDELGDRIESMQKAKFNLDSLGEIESITFDMDGLYTGFILIW